MKSSRVFVPAMIAMCSAGAAQADPWNMSSNQPFKAVNEQTAYSADAGRGGGAVAAEASFGDTDNVPFNGAYRSQAQDGVAASTVQREQRAARKPWPVGNGDSDNEPFQGS